MKKLKATLARIFRRRDRIETILAPFDTMKKQLDAYKRQCFTRIIDREIVMSRLRERNDIDRAEMERAKLAAGKLAQFGV